MAFLSLSVVVATIEPLPLPLTQLVPLIGSEMGFGEKSVEVGEVVGVDVNDELGDAYEFVGAAGEDKVTVCVCICICCCC